MSGYKDNMTDDIGIGYFRSIGKRLREKIPGLRFSSTVQEPLERGASGDKTYRMDRVSEDIILEALYNTGHPLTIVSEEAGMIEIKGGGLRVLVDPVDGSKNAVTGIPMFCASMALVDGDRVSGLKMSYIINVLTGDEYWAVRGEGSFCNGRRLRTQGDDVMRVVLYETQNPGRDVPVILPLISSANRTRCFGSTALDLCFVAFGAASVYVNPAPARSFDFAGGLLIVEEAGGVVTDIEGNSIEDVELSMKRVSPLLVSANGRLHGKALERLSGGR